jgi:hypothetical protein
MSTTVTAASSAAQPATPVIAGTTAVMSWIRCDRSLSAIEVVLAYNPTAARVSQVGNAALIERQAVTLPLDNAFGSELADVGPATIECSANADALTVAPRPRSCARHQRSEAMITHLRQRNEALGHSAPKSRLIPSRVCHTSKTDCCR